MPDNNIPSLRVLLVRPHAELATSQWLQSMIRLEPYAQELIASAVEAPHDVRICDLAVSRKPIKAFQSLLGEYSPHLVGFGGFTSQYRTNLKLARITKERLPEAVTCLGGIHASSVPQTCRAPELFDLIVRGDGVSAIRRIIASMETGDPFPETAAILPTASSDFDMLARQPPPPVHTDGINIRPRRDLVKIEDYFCITYGRKGEKMETLFPQTACIRTSVGCPNRCSFCVVPFLAGGKYLQREVESVVDEIESLPQEYVYFVDDESFINPVRMERIAKMLIRRGIRKKYLAWARSDTICRHPDLFRIWKEAGLELVYIGFESLEEKNLNEYNKRTTSSQNYRARQILRDLDINVHAAFMVNPDFDREDFLTVRKAIRETAPAEFAFTVFSPPPGTELYDSFNGSFICDDPFAVYDCLHTILPTRLPLKKFYRYFAQLYALGAWHIPARVNGVKIPLRDHVRFVKGGIKLGWGLLRMYREYDRKYW